MKQMTLIEMDGFLKGKCIPRDLKVNETNAEYLVRKFAEAQAKCAALAAENAGLKSAFDKPQAYLSWHAIPPTWEDPLPCGEYLDVHDDAGHKNSDGTDCWPVYAKPEIETPATDAFLDEVRAQGVEMAACALDDVNQFNYANMLDDLAQKLRKEASTAELVADGAITNVGE
ncbi:TPA: hypothetical protein JLV47_003939 [Escherichia coli]|uniref:hypothetical protein n=1 Tax=Escherichia coli TaxID=562 RepID=UPI001EFD23A3|nr:hypothetical protein [Escherichia coli]EIP9490476.1 hypothetical protein [Escherichia coli]MCG9404352.1 hypothetical protein [Escherichia coli]HAW4186950.1 hypothetical protein [Escherichia coli]